MPLDAGVEQPNHRLDPDEILALVAKYLDGTSVTKLAREWKLHRDTVLNHLKRHEVSRRPYVRKMTDTQVTEAARSADSP